MILVCLYQSRVSFSYSINLAASGAMSSALFYCCLYFLCLHPLVIAVQRAENMTSGSSLTAGDNSSYVSSNGDFAFGFQLAGTGTAYLLAIWFNRIPERTIIWAANRDNLAQHGSKLQITTGGRFILTSPTGSHIWDANNLGTSAALLDSGNLVFVDFHSTVLWSSFDFPTDTILPTQVWQESLSLVAWNSPQDHSRGRFQLSLQPDGNLVFYTRQSLSDVYYIPAYDATMTFGTDYQLVFNQSGSIYMSGSASVVGVLEDDTDPALYYQRATLDFDGVFRKYVYPRSTSANSTMKWRVKGVRPQSICSRVASGTGVCGFNSICVVGDEEIQRPNCECPPGYSVLDQTDRMEGCNPNFTLQSCLEDPHPNNDKFVLQEMHNINIPDSSAYETSQTLSLDICHNSCLSDCYCAALLFQDVSCKKMRFPLTYLWINNSGASLPSRAFIKLRIGSNNVPMTQPILRHHKETGHPTVILIESVFLGSSILLNILLLALVVFALAFCTSKRKPRTCDDDQDIAGTNMRNFSYKVLEDATNGFREVVGQGAFSTVYKGLLDLDQGRLIAVKKLNEMMKENQREFESEIKAIARTGHRNLVQLIGFCNEGEHRLLVYEYMPNGSLADVLLLGQRQNLWTRIKFGLETARGLNYLHEDCSIQIIHCDIKLQNVLLDDSLTARISDFGLAKLLKKDQAHTVTGIRGTKGYVAPEWFKCVPITTKVDVYSYGILLLELICCRRCFEAELEDENQMVLADWAYDCYRLGKISELVEGDNVTQSEGEGVKKLVMVALWCIQEEPSLRPSMNKVVQIIRDVLEESLPRDLTSHIGPVSVWYGNS